MDAEETPQEIVEDPSAAPAEQPAADQEGQVAEPAPAAEPVPVVLKSLLPEHVSPGLSILARTGSGLAHAFTKLDIHGTDAETLTVLEQFPHLRYVDVSENLLVDISALSKLEFLLTLNAMANRIKALPMAMNDMKYLQSIVLAKNGIKELNWTHFPMLISLNLNQNHLDRIELVNFPELQVFEARENEIASLGYLNAPKLKHLYLSVNKLQRGEGFNLLTHVETIYLRKNEIAILDGFPPSLHSLKHLNLRSNRITNIEETVKLQPLPALTSLTLIDNPVTEMDNYRIEVLSRLPNLTRLDKKMVSQEEREDALRLKAEREKPKDFVTEDGAKLDGEGAKVDGDAPPS